MTTEEFINKMKLDGFEFSGVENGILRFHKGLAAITIHQDVQPDKVWQGLSISEWCTFYNTLFDYASTLMNEREQHYRVRLDGFYSDNGPQYLTKHHGKIFACAKNQRLKQAFTSEELDEIANQPKFKSVAWLQGLIMDHREEV
ncbi:hypothetical protein FC35_GL001062 [Limosilactobacillus coleohominis DSM 14060]|nr:hypothetical protein FC35_GL001062 [Limosilactobacillus coleohominis DSM 14060]